MNFHIHPHSLCSNSPHTLLLPFFPYLIYLLFYFEHTESILSSQYVNEYRTVYCNLHILSDTSFLKTGIPSISNIQLAVALQIREQHHKFLTHLCLNIGGLTSAEPMQRCYSPCEFMCETHFSCQENITFMQSPTNSGYYNLPSHTSVVIHDP